MKLLLLILLLLFININININNSNDINYCACSGFLLPKQQYIPLYKDTNCSDISCYVINDTISEDYFVFKILQTVENYAFISGGYIISDTTIINGWIELKYITTNLVIEDSIPLYSNHSKKSAIQSHINYPYWQPVKIIKCYKNWLFIEYTDKYQKKSGWLSNEYNCSNPYTTCN